MQYEITAVSNGLIRFTQSVVNHSIDARYCIVLFGSAPENIADFSSDASIAIDIFPKIRDAQVVPGVHGYHNNREAGFELFRMTQSIASFNNMPSTVTG